jgi:hypothetical protein
MPRRAPPGPVEAVHLEAELDRLHQHPPGDFVKARNALVALLKRAGRTGDAETVRLLPKPSLPAWAVNRVYWRDTAAYNELLDAGDRLRAAQRHVLGGGGADLRQAMAERQAAVKRATDAAVRQLREAGQKVTPATRQRIEVNLDAILAAGRGADAPRPGRLATDLAPPGLDLLSTLAGSLAGRARGRPTPPAPKEGTRAGTRQAVPAHPAPRSAAAPAPAPSAPDADAARAREEQRRARRAELEARTAAAQADARARRSRQDLARQEDAVARAQARLRAVRREADRAARARERAEQALARARQTVERTQQVRKDADRALAAASAARDEAAREAAAADESLAEARAALERLGDPPRRAARRR